MMTEKRRVSELRTNPLSLAIYGENEDVSDLAESINQHGLFSPIIIKPDGTILSGHRRFAAVNRLGWEEIECTVHIPANVSEEEIYVIEANRSRVKTVRQLRLEGARLKKLLGEPAMRERIAKLNNVGVSSDGNAPAKQAPKVRTQVEVAKQLGISKSLWNQIDYINKYVEIGNDTAIEAATLLDSGKISIGKAYRMVRKALQELDNPESSGADTDAPDAPEMSMQEYNIACKESVAQHIHAICEILEKVEAMPDDDFNTLPWRTLAARILLVDRYFARLNERVARIRNRSYGKLAEEHNNSSSDK